MNKFLMKIYFFILITIFFLSSGFRFAFAIDFFEIQNPKFVPVHIGIISNSKPEVVAIQNVFKANLEKIIFFKISKFSIWKR